jgi:hypothetical protein
MQHTISRLLWESASTHFQGAGLHEGIAYEYTMAVLVKYRKENIYDRAAALETVLTGACWSP